MSRRAYVGVDLGGKFHQVQVTAEDGRRLGSSFRIGRGREGLAALQHGVRGAAGEGVEAIYTIEATQNFWQELVHPLRRAGAVVYLVSPAKTTALRTFYRRHTKTDTIDAAATSRLPAVDPGLHPVVLGDARFEALRRLARQSWQLREAMANRKRRIMSRVLMVYPGYDEVFRNRYCGASLLFCRRYLDPAKARRLGRGRLGTLLRKRALGKFDADRLARLWAVVENAPELAIAYEDLQRSVNLDLDLLEAEEHAQEQLRERIAELYSEVDPETLLTTVSGLGEFLAAAITAFIAEPGRFHNADQVVALSGLCARKKSSAGSDSANQPLTKHGDPTLRSCLYVAAEIARHYDPELRAFYARLRARGKHHKQAICALAAKILRRCWAVLQSQRPYVVEHHAKLEQAKQEGKTIRESVREVAERLNDRCGVPSPEAKPTQPEAAQQPRCGMRAAAGPNRLRRTPVQPRTRSAATSESGVPSAQGGLR